MDTIRKVLNHNKDESHPTGTSLRKHRTSSLKSGHRNTTSGTTNKTQSKETLINIGVVKPMSVVEDPSLAHKMSLPSQNGISTSLDIDSEVSVEEIPAKSLAQNRPIFDDKLPLDATTETQKVVTPVVHNVIKHLEDEHVVREVEHSRHHHHIVHHCQPVKDTVIREVVHVTNIAPPESVVEDEAATSDSAALFEALGHKYHDEEVHLKAERLTIDEKSKIVKQHTHNHIHNVILPVVERTIVEKKLITTIIHVHHDTHLEPIVHTSIEHEPLTMDEFLKRGGSLKSSVTHTDMGKQLLTRALSKMVHKKSSSSKTSSVIPITSTVNETTPVLGGNFDGVAEEFK